jgi:hypothetical protein
LTAIAILLAIGIQTTPLRAAAKYDYDPSVDFTTYQTFRFLGQGPEGTPRAPRARPDSGVGSPLVEKQIAEAVRAGLEAKGLEFAESGPADMAVAFHTGKRREVVGYGWGPRYRGPRRVAVYEEGTLTVDLIARESRELVWRGSIAASIKDDPEKRHKQIASLVEKVLENYPPPQKR